MQKTNLPKAALRLVRRHDSLHALLRLHWWLCDFGATQTNDLDLPAAQ